MPHLRQRREHCGACGGTRVIIVNLDIKAVEEIELPEGCKNPACALNLLEGIYHDVD